MTTELSLRPPPLCFAKRSSEGEAISPQTETEEFFVNMGPQHPATHGILRLLLKLDGEVLRDITPYIGYLHRNFEKICENRTYTQVIAYTDRLDYLGAMNNNFGYCMTVERLMGITIPERAEYIRVIMTELNRVASHMVWLGTFALDLGAWSVLLYCFREREEILNLYEETCGARLTYSYMRVGGVSRDLPDGFVEKAKRFVNYCRPKIDDYEALLSKNAIFLERTKGVGILPKELAINYGVSGPTLRGSGIKWDLRKDEPYSIYEHFKFDVPVMTNGDCWDRYKVRVEEMRQSLMIVEQALNDIPGGDIIAKLPRVIRPPKGEVYFRSESPRGELGFYIVSDNSPKPYRIKVRAPSFSNLSCLPEICKGWKVADVVAILGSIDIVLGELDR